MPNTYVKKAERERKAQTDTIVETLLGICTDPHAPPETKLGAVKTLKPIQDLEHQVAIKDQQISDFGTLIWPHFGRLIWPHLIYSDRSSYPVPASRDGEGDGQETQGGTV